MSLKGTRLTTLELEYPRFIHAEFMTHRDFSRNASSSRAIPVKRMIANIKNDPAMPIFWGKNQKGMQASEECNELIRVDQPFLEVPGWIGKESAWLVAMERALQMAEEFDAAGYHKQIVNRLIEPFMHIKVVVSSTKWENFFTLRLHKDAEPHIQLLAQRIKEAMDKSQPKRMTHGHWHLPYVEAPRSGLLLDQAIKMSVARCARVSYNNFDGKPPSLEEDLALYERLIGSQPLHASPAEHQATPDYIQYGDGPEHWKYKDWWGNFHEWVQYRKTLPGEYVS